MIWRREKLNKEEWHTWFAWKPVAISKWSMVWLETIERRLVIGQFDSWWKYRLKD